MSDASYEAASASSPSDRLEGKRTVEIRYVHPLQLGKVLAALYAFFVLIALPIPIYLLIVDTPEGAPEGIVLITMLVMYPVMGFIFGVVVAFVYNLIVKMTGGVRLDMS